MRIAPAALAIICTAFFTLASPRISAQAREEGRLLTAGEVLTELMGSPDQAVPDRLLERAYGIAVIPDLTKVAFFAGGRHGRGVLVVRDKQGHFGNPVFVSMTGGSIGWQWGVQLTDVVLVFTTPKGIQGISGGKVTLGADASVAAGPVGRQASAATDTAFKAEVYSYSRNRGVFAGIALDGTAINIDDDANEAFYKKPGVTAAQIMAGEVTTQDDAARRFLAAVASSTGTPTRSASAEALPPPQNATAAPPAAGAVTTTTAPAPAASSAQTFPLADPQPGQEPK